MPTPALKRDFTNVTTPKVNELSAAEYNLNALRTDTAYDDAKAALAALESIPSPTSLRLALWNNFADDANGSPSMADSGQAWVKHQLRAQSAPVIASGRYVSNDTLAGMASTYLGANTGADITYIGSRFVFGTVGSTDGGGPVFLATAKDVATSITENALNATAHVSFSQAGYQVGVFLASTTQTLIGTYTYAAGAVAATAVHDIEIAIDKLTNALVVRGADGIAKAYPFAAGIAAIDARWATAEIYYTAASTDKRVSVLTFEADTRSVAAFVGAPTKAQNLVREAKLTNGLARQQDVIDNFATTAWVEGALDGKADTADLLAKLDKITDEVNIIYGVDFAGGQSYFPVDSEGQGAYSVPLRDAAGRIRMANGAAGFEGVNYAQVQAMLSAMRDSLINGAPGTYDTLGEIATWITANGSAIAAIAAKVDKTSTPMQMYGTDNAGNQITGTYSDAATANTLALRGAGGVLAVGDGTASGHAATKGQLDAERAVARTLTNARINPRVLLLSNVTPVNVNSDLYDAVEVTGLTTNPTVNGPTGTPVVGQRLRVALTGTATRTISWGGIFVGNGFLTLPSSITGTGRRDVEFIWTGTNWRMTDEGTPGITGAGMALIDDVDIAAQRLTLGGVRLRTVISTVGAATLAAGVNCDYLVFITNAAHPQTLPTAVGNTASYTLVNTTASTVNVPTTSSQTIHGQTAPYVLQPGESITLVPNNVNWWIV